MPVPPSARRAAAVLLLAVAASGCGMAGGVLEIMTDGGERTLREPMRPQTPGPRVLVLALDGVGDAVLRDALATGRMPRLAGLVGPAEGDVWAHAYAVPGAPAVFPAETAAGWAALFTGEPQARNGVAGNEWFVRDSAEVFAPVPLSVGTIEQTLQIYTDDLMGQILQVPTLFERADVRSHVSMGFVHRGADVLNPPDLGDLPDLLAAGLRVVFGGDPVAAGYRALDDDTWTGVRRSARRHGLPRLQVAYFPGVDLATHAEGPTAQFDHLRDVVDERIGDILDLYQDTGALRDTYVLVVSDHGHTPVLADSVHSLAEGAGGPRDVFASIGRRLRPFEIGADSTEDYQAVLTYNEAVALVTVADQRTCPDAGDACDWTRAPRLEEDVLPVARAFAEAGRTGAHAAGLRGAIDLVFARATQPGGPPVPYRVLDPASGQLVAVADYLARTPRPDLLDLERRLGWLTDGPLGHRGGDVLILAKAGLDRPIEERFYFGAPRSSGHGSAAHSDGAISFVVAHARRQGSTMQALVTGAVGPDPTQLSVTPLILRLLGVEAGAPGR